MHFTMKRRRQDMARALHKIEHRVSTGLTTVHGDACEEPRSNVDGGVSHSSSLASGSACRRKRNSPTRLSYASAAEASARGVLA